jgi:hypothetical protein
MNAASDPTLALIACQSARLSLCGSLSLEEHFGCSEDRRVDNERQLVSKLLPVVVLVNRDQRAQAPEGGLRLAFRPHGKLLAGVQPEPMPFVHVWTLDPERLLQIARQGVTRSLTEDECRRHLHRSCTTHK